MNKVIIGYSGHAYVVIDCIIASGGEVSGYFDLIENEKNPFHLQYLGSESAELLKNHDWIVGIGDNKIRERIIEDFDLENLMTVIHPCATISQNVEINAGSFVSANSIINPFVNIGLGCIVNTGAIIEHECSIHDFAHIAPGTVLAGNVVVGKRSFIGANATVIQGITIGHDVVVGAGSVIIEDIPNNCTVVGNPGRITKKET